MDEPQPHIAFIAAALALLVLPLLVVVGLGALGLAAGLLTPADRMASGSMDRLLLALFGAWVALAVVAVLAVVARLTHRRMRS